MKKIVLSLAIASAAILAGCDNAATVASRNISQASDQFEIVRRVVFFNGITDKYLLSIEGKCSIDLSRTQVIAVTCKTNAGDYKKHYLGLSDNVSYFVEQLNPANVSEFHYRVIFRPQVIVPEVDLQTSREELFKDRH